MARSILIRADGGHGIGIGHLVRSLSFAREWTGQGGRVIWLSLELDENFREILSRDGIETLDDIPAKERGTAFDIRRTLEVAKHYSAEEVWLDGYVFGAKFQAALAEAGLSLNLVDDVGFEEDSPARYIINGNLYANADLYPNVGSERLLVGGEFALLRREFSEGRSKAIGREKILIAMGGEDPLGWSSKILETLVYRSFKDEKILVLTSQANQNTTVLREKVNANPESVSLFVNPPSVSKVMNECKLAVVTSSSIVWELACLGIPMLGFSLADNQIPIGNAIASSGIGAYGGDLRSLSQRKIDDVISTFLSSPMKEVWSKNGKKQIDGRGSSRVVEVIRNGF